MKDKFEQFKKACEGDIKIIIIARLDVLGDNVKEVKENVKYAIKHGCEIYIADLDVKIARKRQRVNPVAVAE